MAIIPNGVFERDQFAAGRQNIEQSVTPQPPPTAAQLINMTIGQTPRRQDNNAGPFSLSQLPSVQGIDQGIGQGINYLTNTAAAGGANLRQGIGAVAGAGLDYLRGNFQDVDNAASFVEGLRPQGGAQASVPAPATEAPQAPGVNGGDVPASGPVQASARPMQGEWAPAPINRPAAPLAEAPIAPRGVYSDALTPQFSAANTMANGVPAPSGGGAGLSVVGNFGMGTPVPAAAPNVGGSGPGGAYRPGQDPMYMDPNRNAGGGQTLVMGGGGQGGGGLQAAIDNYMSMDAGGGSEGSRARQQARQVMETLAGLEERQIGADASLGAAGIGANATLAAASMGADNRLQTTGMDNQTTMAQALINAQVQQRRNAIDEQFNTGRLGVWGQQAEADMLAAQPSFIEQVQAGLLQQQLQGEQVNPNTWNMANLQPLSQGFATLPVGERVLGFGVGGEVRPLTAQQELLMERAR